MAWERYPDPDEGWITVQHRRGRQRRWQPADRERPARRDTRNNRVHPPQHWRRSYASVTRGHPASRSRSSRPPRNRYQPHRQPRPRSRSRDWNAAPRRRRYQQQQRRQQQRNRYVPRGQNYGQNRNHYQQSVDPNFSEKVRVLHRLLKATHHLNNVSRDDRDPPAIQRIMFSLASTIKPAHPTSKTLDLIEGNARNWAFNTVTILRDHYTEVRAAEKRTLLGLGGDLLAPLEVAVRWAQRNLGRRFNLQTADEVQLFLVEEEQRAASPSSSSRSPAASPAARAAPSPPPSSSSSSSSSSPSGTSPAHRTERQHQDVDGEENQGGSPRHPQPPPRSPSPPPPGPVTTTPAAMTTPPHTGWTPPPAAIDEGSNGGTAPPPLPQRQQRSCSSCRRACPAPGTPQTAPPLPPLPPGTIIKFFLPH